MSSVGNMRITHNFPAPTAFIWPVQAGFLQARRGLGLVMRLTHNFSRACQAGDFAHLQASHVKKEGLRPLGQFLQYIHVWQVCPSWWFMEWSLLSLLHQMARAVARGSGAMVQLPSKSSVAMYQRLSSSNQSSKMVAAIASNPSMACRSRSSSSQVIRQARLVISMVSFSFSLCRGVGWEGLRPPLVVTASSGLPARWSSPAVLRGLLRGWLRSRRGCSGSYRWLHSGSSGSQCGCRWQSQRFSPFHFIG